MNYHNKKNANENNNVKNFYIISNNDNQECSPTETVIFYYFQTLPTDEEIG